MDFGFPIGRGRWLVASALERRFSGARRAGPVGRPSGANPVENPKREVLAGGLEPASRKFGFDRGRPVDRYYIERFLEAHRADISGHVIEVGGRGYTERFGGAAVLRSDVLGPAAGTEVTVVCDLGAERPPGRLPACDCFIATQVLPFIFDVRAAVRNLHACLGSGGVLLLTVPGISQISQYDARRWGDFWRFTPQSVARLLETCFTPGAVTVRAYGNLRAAVGLLDGRADSELAPAELDAVDDDYPVIIAARAVRAA